MVYSVWEFSCRPPILSGDGSKVFLYADGFIQARSIKTGKLMGKIRLEGVQYYYSNIGDGSKVWVDFEDSYTQGWDFGISGSTPIPISDVATDSPHLESSWQGNSKRYRIRDQVTDSEVFQLSGKYVDPTGIRWDGQYLVAGYVSGEMLILDFSHVLHQWG